MARKKSNVINVHLMAPVCEALYLCDYESLWGFSITHENQSAFVSIGTREGLEKAIIKYEEYVLLLVVKEIVDSSDDVANELLELSIDCNMGIVINGEHYSSEEIERTRDNVTEG